MKFACSCGATVFDHGSYRGHLVSDDDLARVLDEVDEAIEGPHKLSSDALCMKVRMAVAAVLRLAWQCGSCGRLYVNADGGQLHEWAPRDGALCPRVFKGESKSGA